MGLGDFVQKGKDLPAARLLLSGRSSQLRQIQKLDREATQPCENHQERKNKIPFKKVKVLLVEVWATSVRIVTVVSSGSSDTLSFSAAVKQGKVK